MTLKSPLASESTHVIRTSTCTRILYTFSEQRVCPVSMPIWSMLHGPRWTQKVIPLLEPADACDIQSTVDMISRNVFLPKTARKTPLEPVAANPFDQAVYGAHMYCRRRMKHTIAEFWQILHEGTSWPPEISPEFLCAERCCDMKDALSQSLSVLPGKATRLPQTKNVVQ